MHDQSCIKIQSKSKLLRPTCTNPYGNIGHPEKNPIKQPPNQRAMGGEPPGGRPPKGRPLGGTPPADGAPNKAQPPTHPKSTHKEENNWS